MQSFKVLEREVDHALTLEEQGSTTPAFKATVPKVALEVAFGFTQTAEDALVDAEVFHRQERLKQINAYKAHANKLRDSLKAKGIEPIAIITRKAWYQIVEEKGLLIVQPNRHGKVGINRDWLGRPPIFNYLHWITAAVCAVLFVVLLIGWSRMLGTPQSEGPVIAFLGTAAFFAMVEIGLVESFVVDPLQNWRKRMWIGRKFQGLTHEQLLRKVCHHGKLQTWNDWDGHSISLPPPPVGVVAMIKKFATCNDDKLSIAAEPAAICLVGGWQKVFEAEIAQMEREEEARRRDPILFTECGEAVAILAQYGPEFKLELAAIEAVVNSEHLL